MLELDTSPNMLNVLVLLALSISVRPISQESTPGPDAIASHTWSGVASTVISSRTSNGCVMTAAPLLAGGRLLLVGRLTSWLVGRLTSWLAGRLAGRRLR